MFDEQSRYRALTPYLVTDRRGRAVPVVPVPPAPEQEELGIHLRREGQRLDHLAHEYLKDAAGFWRIADMNDVMLPDALAEAREIRIPRKTT
ncbi:MAG TPA: hypothetical protein VNZ57_15745 [Longimicrobiales bacterium]|nr:hypothetical protein [Longimicrobiales bacterium]